MPTAKTKPAPAKTATAKKPAAKPPAAKPAVKKTAAKPATKTAAKPTAKAAAKPVARAATKTAAKAAPKAATKSPAKAAAAKGPAKKPVTETAVKAAKTKAPAPKLAAPKDEIAQLAMDVAKVLDTNKATEIVTIPLAGRSPLADWMVIASGTSARQVGALANYVQRAFAQAGYKRLRTEGLPQGDWVVVDSGDVVVHLFRPEVRDFYQLDRLWLEEEGEPVQTRRLK